MTELAIPKPPEQDTPEAREYNRKRRWLSVIDAVLGFALLLVILISGFTKNMRDLAVRFSRDHYALALFLYIIFLAAILKFAAFGLDYFGFRLEHYYHLSNQKLRSWLLDELKGWLLSIVLIAFLALQIPGSLATRDDDYSFVRTLVDIHRQVAANYVEPVEEPKLREAAIDGMLSELDPFSIYVPPAKQEDFDRMLEGSFKGVGIELDQKENGPIEVVSTSANPHLRGLAAQVRADSLARLSVDLHDLAAFHARHDLQIGASGGATWERCCVGVPSLSMAR